MSTGTASGWIRTPFHNRRTSDLCSIRCRNPFLGTTQSHWFPTGPEVSLSKVWVAADYSDSAPDSSSHIRARGYHPLEELKDCEKGRHKVLTDAEIAKTTLEANSSAVLVFPAMIHCEPHQQISWAEFQYVIDDYGDIFFEIFDDENIMQDHGASNPVSVWIGMDLPLYGVNKSASGDYIDHHDSGGEGDISFDGDTEEVGDTEVASTLIAWGMPETLRSVHPLYFARRLAKAVHTTYTKKMNHPSNGLAIVGCLRPAFIDEESYVRKLFLDEDGNGYVSEWRDDSEKEEEPAATYNLIGDLSRIYSFIAENLQIAIFKLHNSAISLQDFQEAEPDILVHSASAILDHFSEYGMKSSTALKDLCRRKKGLHVEGANLIGVDSLGMDVRVFSGVEAQTLRFSFKDRATSEIAAEKKIRQMLFPRHYRKSYKGPSNSHRESDSL